MYIATWNLNNRVGKVRFHREASEAAIDLNADILVFTEFFPNPMESEVPFRAELKDAGWNEQLSTQTSEVANRILIASRLPMSPMTLDLPTFDQQFPSNLLGVNLPSVGLSVLGVRVPAYSTANLLFPAWEWLEATTTTLKSTPSIVIGDLNVQTSSTSRAGDHFRRILANGWHRAAPGAATFFGHKGKNSEIDHILATDRCILSDAVCVRSSAISDHAALRCRVELVRSEDGRIKPR